MNTHPPVPFRPHGPRRVPTILAALLLGGLVSSGCRHQPAAIVLSEPTVVEAACGECLLGLPGKSCDLAIRQGDQAWFVDGVHLDDHGDAHAADGMCQVVRKARVTGEVHRGRFKASSFTLLPP